MIIFPYYISIYKISLNKLKLITLHIMRLISTVNYNTNIQEYVSSKNSEVSFNF
jgi:hypothetical protein